MGTTRRTFRLAVGAAGLVAVCTLGLRAGQISVDDAELQYQLGNLLIEETRYHEALDAFDRATRTTDPELAQRARKGKVKMALRIAEFDLALSEAERLTTDARQDAESLTLHGDALWSAGLFLESDRLYERAIALEPSSSRAQFGIARSLATRNRLEEALDTALRAVAAAPRDGEIHHAVGDIYERLHRFDEAVAAYNNYINLLPNRDRSEKAAWSRAQVRFLEAFAGRTPVEIDEQDNGMLHTVPFRLVRDKVVVQARVNGGNPQDFVLDTGAEETVLSAATARRVGVRPITYTLSAGVGEIGLRGLELARLDRLEIGTLQIRNLPVMIKNPALRGIPTREGESFSPLSLGMSMTIDYQQRLLTIGRKLPDAEADIRLPMRVHRLAMVRGLLNATRPAYFVVDTGGEVISISAATADSLAPSPFRRIPLRVYGTSGWDPDAFLLPGVDLDFESIAFRNFPLVVLNLRAPSVLLGFQVGGIVGHKFLGSYRVTMDMAGSELKLEEF
ncbi:MAG: retroviral-like aspartic protease family protein [Acidobacteria bacterium]|nr:retroviral-like aspartic protease family protein [Acidobacteriota bacterium]